MRILLSALLIFSLSACAVGMLTPNREFRTTDTFTLSKRTTNFIEGASSVGEALGYDIASVDRNGNAVTLTNNSSAIGVSLIGKMQQMNFTLTLRPDDRTVDVQVSAFGNMSSVTQEKIEARVSELQTALRKQFS